MDGDQAVFAHDLFTGAAMGQAPVSFVRLIDFTEDLCFDDADSVRDGAAHALIESSPIPANAKAHAGVFGGLCSSLCISQIHVIDDVTPSIHQVYIASCPSQVRWTSTHTRHLRSRLSFLGVRVRVTTDDLNSQPRPPHSVYLPHGHSSSALSTHIAKNG